MKGKVNSARPYCACATPSGPGGLSVIRMAGEGSADVLDRVFRLLRTADSAHSVSEMRGYTAAYGRIVDPDSGRGIDEVVVTRFTPPHSYTGEEAVEISCHGGLAVRQEILRVLLQNGARMAEPGEFTKNAFLAGKMDLSQAEAVMDVIQADSRLYLAAAEDQLFGSLKATVRSVSDLLYASFSALEMMVEFPEHEDTPDHADRIVSDLREAGRMLNDLLPSYEQGRILKDGMRVALGGLPNSGKSSLLNRLTGYDRAIVTDIPGTTRDTLDVAMTLEDVPVRLFDTAGLRHAEEEIERLGIERAKDALRAADLLLWLHAPDTPVRESAEELLRLLSDTKPRLVGVLFSKSDKEPNAAVREKNAEHFLSVLREVEKTDIRFALSLSSLTGEGVESLRNAIRSIYDEKGQASAAGVILINERHFCSLQNAANFVRETADLLTRGEPPDIACSVLRYAMEELGEITGETVGEELVRTIFSRFCVGK